MNFLRAGLNNVTNAIGITENNNTDNNNNATNKGKNKDEMILNNGPINPLNSFIKLEDVSQRNEDLGETCCGSYSETSSSVFDLRIGPNYPRNKQKAPSMKSICDLIGVDLLKSGERINNIASKMNLPSEWFDKNNRNIKTKDKEAYTIPGLPELFIINAQIPTTGLGGGISSFFTGEDDGEGVSLIFYFKWRKEVLKQLKKNNGKDASPASKLLLRYIQEAPKTQGASDDPWRGRFKVIVQCTNIEELGLPGFITAYNAKPVLVKAAGTIHKTQDYFEQDINVHAFTALSKKGLGMMMSKFPQCLFDVGFCIESRDDDEMPECLLGCAAVNQSREDKAPFIDISYPQVEKDSESGEEDEGAGDEG